MLIFSKERTLKAFESQAKKGIDEDFIIVKLQKILDDGVVTQEEIQHIIDIINPPVEIPIV